MERRIIRRSTAKSNDSSIVRFDDVKKNSNNALEIDFWDKLAMYCQKSVSRLNLSGVVFILSGVFALGLIVSGIMHFARQDNSATYVLNASLNFENTEYDFYVHKFPVKFSEGIKILNHFNGSRLWDYRVIRPDVIKQLENSLTTDIPINPNEPINATELLLGTHLLWTGAFYDWSNSKSFKLLHYNDTAITKLAKFPGMHKGQCHSGKQYERYMNSMRLKNTGGPLYFRIAIQISCKAQRNDAYLLSRRCSGTCGTIVADDVSSPRHLIGFYKRKELPKIDFNKVLLNVTSADKLWQFIFHDVKVSREGLERITRHLGAETLSMSLFDDENFEKISKAFKKVDMRGIENQELLFWTSGFFNFSDFNPRLLNWGNESSGEIQAFEHWCNHHDYIGDEPGVALERYLVSYLFSEMAKDDDHIHYVQLRVRDFYHESFRYDPPCLSMDGSDDNTGEAMFHLAYRLPVNRLNNV